VSERWSSNLKERPLLSRRFVAFGLLFALGLALRVALVPYLGTQDMEAYAQWGQQTNHAGLTSAYIGIYFPLAYQLFAGEVTLAGWLGVSTFTVIKAVNLLFDLGTFAALLWFLREHRLDVRYALYYWLHPFFLAIFWLGYVDSFVSCCAMLALALLARSRRVAHAFLAGIPVAAAAVFKPQALTLIVMTVLLLAGLLIIGRRITARIMHGWAFLAPSGLAFLGYSFYFQAKGFRFSYLLEHSFHSLKTFSPSLTANMLNIWTPVADHYVEPGKPLYTVVGPGIYHVIGDLLVGVGFVLSAVFVTVAGRRRELAWQVMSVITLGALILPVVGTRAHENHLFLGLTFAIVALAAAPTWPFVVALNVLLAMQFVNLGARYGFGLNHLTNWGFVQDIVKHYGISAQVAAAWVTIVSFPFVAFFVSRALIGTRAEKASHLGRIGPLRLATPLGWLSEGIHRRKL
jgi:hypothetical protein